MTFLFYVFHIVLWMNDILRQSALLLGMMVRKKEEGVREGGRENVIRALCRNTPGNHAPYKMATPYIMYCSIIIMLIDGRFSCFVFRVSSKEKAYAMALSITKAFTLACQILQEQQGLFPPTPEREMLFEPQHADDTKVLLMILRYLTHYIYLCW